MCTEKHILARKKKKKRNNKCVCHDKPELKSQPMEWNNTDSANKKKVSEVGIINEKIMWTNF